ncbi:MAG: cation:proton antiporter [Candidatus Heimdallarchaeota archaeon]
MATSTLASSPITILLYLGVALLTARILGEIFERIKLSSIIGELLAGIIFGGPFLGMIGANPKLFVDIEVLKQFSQIGIIILLFIIGLEVNTKNLRKSGKKSLIISLIEVLVALGGGFLTGLFILDFTIPQAIFFGTMFTATSIGVTVRTLNDIGRLNTSEGEILLSTAILDDFIALFLVLIFTSALFPGGSRPWYISTLIDLGILTALIICVVIIIPRVLRFLENRLRIFSNSSTKFLSTGIIFGILALLVYFAEILGVSGAIVAFLFGLSLQKNKVLVGEIKDIFTKMGEGLFLPLFFFGVGATFLFDFSSFSPIILLIVPIAIIAKGIGTFTGASVVGFKPKDSAKITIGMMPRAEIVLVIAEIGLMHGIFSQSIYSMAVLLVFVTIIITPIALRLAFRKPKAKPPDDEIKDDELNNLELKDIQTTVPTTKEPI